MTALTAEQSAALMPAAPATNEFGDNDDGEAPWHDQTLPMGERMKLAEDRPLRRRFMAAMAQQDCGQCGYNCEDYANAIFRKQEARLNLCVPGGKETARMLKKLNEEFVAAPPSSGREEGRGLSQHLPRKWERVIARASRRGDLCSPRCGSTSRARTRRPGMSSSILAAPVSPTRSAIASVSIRATIRPWSMP